MIPPDELDSFHADLAGALRLYKSKTAKQIGQRALRKFAKELDTRRERYDDALSSDGAKALLKAACGAVKDLNSSMEKLAGLLRNLASLVAAYQQPPMSGGLSGFSEDLDTLSTKLDVVKESIEQLMKRVDAAKDVLSRPSRGSVNRSRTAPQRRSYWRDPIAVGAEYRW